MKRQRLMIPLMLLLILSLILGISGCAATVRPVPITSIELPPTPMPDDAILKRIVAMREKIGAAPRPVKVTQNGVTYIAFTQEQMKKISAKGLLTKYLQETVELMHHRNKIYVMEVNQLKRLAKLQNVEIEAMQRIYVDARNDANKSEHKRWVEGILYKLTIAGQIIAILLLL